MPTFLMLPGESVQAAVDRLARDVVRKSGAPLSHGDALAAVFRQHGRDLYEAYRAEALGVPPPARTPRPGDAVHVLPGESATRVIKRTLGPTYTWDQLAAFWRETPSLYEQYRREMTVGSRE
jgi:hypothetical protein